MSESSYAYMIDNDVLLITDSSRRDTHELLERCHPGLILLEYQSLFGETPLDAQQPTVIMNNILKKHLSGISALLSEITFLQQFSTNWTLSGRSLQLLHEPWLTQHDRRWCTGFSLSQSIAAQLVTSRSTPSVQNSLKTPKQSFSPVLVVSGLKVTNNLNSLKLII